MSATPNQWMEPATVVSLHKRALTKWHPGMTDRSLEELRHRAAVGFHQYGVYLLKSMLLRQILVSFDDHGTGLNPSAAALAMLPRDSGDRAARYFDTVLAFAPNFAESAYNRASLYEAAGQLSEAAKLYERVLTLSPHPCGKPHAFLQANAAWQAAKIAHQTGRLNEAGELFEFATSRLDNFGVDHRCFADHLRAIGNFSRAVAEYDRTMAYSHRYAPEFIEPDYPTDERLPIGPAGDPLDPLQATTIGTSSDGVSVVHFLRLYFTLPRRCSDPRADDLVKTIRRLRTVEMLSDLIGGGAIRCFGSAGDVRTG
jgi:tetratricopeptide (TPR) repeat protein